MVKKFHRSGNDSHFIISSIDTFKANETDGTFRIIWVQNGTLKMSVDYERVMLSANQIICLAPNQHIEIEQLAEGYTFQYNRDFYCLVDHDHEISCVGLLYYGTSQTPTIKLDAKHQRKIESLMEVFVDEFDTKDTIQEEMLRMLLKRLIIICTRLFKDQAEVSYKEEELDVIRQFHVLVEKNYKEKQKVGDYAELLNKSAKTLSNLFSKNSEKPPLRQIHERIALEAKRLLYFTDKSIKEIGWELGFEEEAHFSRFFKRLNGQSATKFRNMGKIDNSSGKVA